MVFEVASVKPTKLPRLPGFPLNSGDAKPAGGRFSASFRVDAFILFAYKLNVFEAKEVIAQLPKWANEDYAIDAKAEGNPTKDQMRLMMQSLLADRFKLRVHFENREGPVLALVLAKGGQLGPKLIPHSEGPPCPESFAMPNPFTAPRLKLPNPTVGDVWPPQCGTGGQILGTNNGLWIGSRDTTMATLADAIYTYASLDEEIDRPVVDQTGLTGRFDFILELASGSIAFFPKPPNLSPADPDAPPPEPKGTPLLDALRTQLGLKLVQSRGDIRRLIIDHIEAPSDN